MRPSRAATVRLRHPAHRQAGLQGPAAAWQAWAEDIVGLHPEKSELLLPPPGVLTMVRRILAVLQRNGAA